VKNLIHASNNAGLDHEGVAMLLRTRQVKRRSAHMSERPRSSSVNIFPENWKSSFARKAFWLNACGVGILGF